MATVGFIALFVLLGIGVLFVAFSGGPTKAREAYLTRGGRFFRVVMLLLFLGLGIALPAAVIADRDEGPGNDKKAVENAKNEKRLSDGKDLFRANCSSCHNLDAANARGITGPDLDEVGEMNVARVGTAIKNGGSAPVANTGRMPAGLLQGDDASKVAEFVSAVAGK